MAERQPDPSAAWWRHDCRLNVRELPPDTLVCDHCGARKPTAATTCEHGYTGDERDSCACLTCSEQQLLAKVKELTALLREFEALPVRRLTNETAVYERSPLDVWRARCGEAVHGWL